MNSGEREMNPVAMTAINPQKEYWLNQRFKLVHSYDMYEPFFYVPASKDRGHILFDCYASFTNVTCKLNISLLLQNYLNYNPHEDYFLQYAPN